MSRPLFVKKDGVQKAVTDGYVKQNGEYKKIKLFFTKKNGEWVHKHEYGDWVTTSYPSCETAGSQVSTCPCAACQTKPIAALGHNWNSGVVTTTAACSQNGVKTFTCKNNASHTKTEVIDKDPDTHLDVHIAYNDVASTCKTAGWYYDLCNDCGRRLNYTQREIDPNNHGDVQEYINEPATCISEGSYWDMCYECGTWLNHKTTPALGHDYTYTKNTTLHGPAPTTHTKGCSRCAYEVQEDCSAASNNYYSPSGSTTHWKLCKCGNKVEEAYHQPITYPAGDTYCEICWNGLVSEKNPVTW